MESLASSCVDLRLDDVVEVALHHPGEPRQLVAIVAVNADLQLAVGEANRHGEQCPERVEELRRLVKEVGQLLLVVVAQGLGDLAGGAAFGEADPGVDTGDADVRHVNAHELGGTDGGLDLLLAHQ